MVTEMSPAMRSSVMLRLPGAEGERPDGFAGGEVSIVADVDLAVEAAELEVGAAGVELDGAADAFEVRIAEEVAAAW